VSYPILVMVSVVLALSAVTVAAVVAVLTLARRRRWAQRGVGVILALLTGAAAFGFLASAEGDHNLQQQTHLVMSLARSAEHSEHARTGRYTSSITRLSRLNRGLATEIRVEGAWLVATRSKNGDRVRLQDSLGFQTNAETIEAWTPKTGAPSHRAPVRT
jgi:hypothetical protein